MGKGLSPMMQQYLRIKEENPDTLLFFRLGDFYEMFFDDAKLASRELELTLTGRDCGLDERAPMCGVPYHSYEAYVARLVEKGYRVAICEQMEDPALAKDLVKREIVRIITPGTVIESSMLDEGSNNYLCAAVLEGSTGGLCFADVSTGSMQVTELTEDAVGSMCGELGKFRPSEVLMDSGAAGNTALSMFVRDRLGALCPTYAESAFEAEQSRALVERHFSRSVEELGLEGAPNAVRALGAALSYLYQTQRTGLERIQAVSLYSEAQFMQLDPATRRNLELTETMRTKEKKGSLLGVLDRTKTAMGKRMLRSWIEQPLLSCGRITQRLSAVEALKNAQGTREELLELLAGVFDMERLITRIVYGSAGARELKALERTIVRLPGIRRVLRGCTSGMLSEIYDEIDELSDLSDLIGRAIVEEPPVTVREGGMIAPGFDPQLDAIRSELGDSRGIITRVETAEREKTGIKNLKVGYNKVFGYYIEVTRSYLSQVPEDYIRKQTLANCERYITQELKQLEARVLGAQEQIVAMEYRLYEQVRGATAAQLSRIQRTAQAVARLDVLCSFAEVAFRCGYCRPEVTPERVLEIHDGRHPVVETMLRDVPFVPNDTLLDGGENRVAIITGPNMAGKSTYMRQTALIALMAQIGSFVPAKSARVGIADSIFTRVGASDDLSSGQSTFMVEMSEVAHILKNATPNSLLILDEIGRGTSTFDGMSIARAVLEFAADKKKLGARTLFATHYHELTALEEQLEGVKNYNIAVKKRGDDIIFLRRIVRGGADDSYGVEVAKLAGVPDWVISRAKKILHEMETTGKAESTPGRKAKAPRAFEPEMEQLSLAPSAGEQIVERLKATDVNTLTPLEALNLLYELCRQARE